MDNRDYFRYLELWRKYKGELDFDVYAYVLMPNHVHWLLKTGITPLPEIIHRMHSTYARWFNHRHDRVGHLFQNRYKSYVCDTDSYLLVLARYIHLNPVRAGLVKDIHHYPWSSFPYYCGREDTLLNTYFLLEYYGRDIENARLKFTSFTLEGIGRDENPADIYPKVKSPEKMQQKSSPRENRASCGLAAGRRVNIQNSSPEGRQDNGYIKLRQKEKRQQVPSMGKAGLDLVKSSSMSTDKSINSLDMEHIAGWVEKETGVTLAEMRSNSQQNHIVLARYLFIIIAVGEAGIKRCRVAEFLNKHRSLVTRTIDKWSTRDVPPRAGELLLKIVSNLQQN